MFYVAVFYKDKDRDLMVSCSISTRDGFRCREDTGHTSLRQAVVDFLEYTTPDQFSITEGRSTETANGKKEIAVYYSKTVHSHFDSSEDHGS